MMNIKKLSMKKILSKLNFIEKLNDDSEYTPIDHFTGNSDDDFDDYISVDQAYDFRDPKDKDKLPEFEIDVNHNYLRDIKPCQA